MKKLMKLLPLLLLLIGLAVFGVRAAAAEDTAAGSEIAGTLPAPEVNEAAPTSGSCGANANWAFSNGILTISGTGPMDDFSAEESGDESHDPAPWNHLMDSITKIVIQNGITSVGDWAFYECSELTTAEIADSVTSIGYCSFCVCMKLTSVQISSKLTKIDNYAFGSCIKLLSISLPDTLESIGEGAFEGCESITTITIPARIDTIPAWTFAGCPKLTTVYVKDNIATIGTSAFQYCSSLAEFYVGTAEENWQPEIYSGNDVLDNVQFHFGHVFEEKLSINAKVLGAESAVLVSWTSVSDASSYQLYKKPSGGSWKKLASVSGTDYTDQDVVFGSKYSYKVRAVVNGSAGDFCDPDTVLFNIFEDVDPSASWFSHLVWAYNNGIISGTSKTTFSPNKACTRYQFAVMLYKLAGKPKVSNVTLPFTDVPENATYRNAVAWAYSNKIISGTSKTTFSPLDEVTRYQVVQMLYKYAGKPSYGSVPNPFDDVASGASYYNAVMWAVQKKITSGTSATTFSPNASCQRYQMTIFLHKFNNIYHIIQ